MKTIKTREKATGIKVLDKTVNLSSRMKNAYIRTKDRAEETQQPRNSSPSEYAADSVQNTAQGAAENAITHLPNPVKNARRSIEKAKDHFEEVKQNMPEQRQRSAEQAQKTAQKAKSNAETLQKTADKAQEAARDAKSAVKDAKQTLREVKQAGRQTIHEVKQKAKIEQRGFQRNTAPENTRATESANPARGDIPKNEPVRTGNAPRGESSRPVSNAGPQNSVKGGGSRPNYMNKGIKAPKGADNAAKPLQSAGKSSGKNALKSGAKSTAKGFKKTAKGTVKTAKKTVKTAERTAKAAVKTAQRTAKAAQKTAQTTARAAKLAAKAAQVAAKAAVTAAKVTVKVVAALVKATIAAVKGLIAAIAAGGWIAVLIILVVCLIALLVGSILGIFFSGEDSGTGKTVNSVITEINTEYTDKIDGIIAANPHDLLDMSGARAAWKQVLTVYTVRTVSDPANPTEVATMDDTKAALLREVFWDMNAVSYETDTVDVEEDVIGEDGLPTGETTTVSKTVLRITVSHKTTDEMAAAYGFDTGQAEWINELLKPEYHSLWNGLLYGITSIGDGSLLEFADTQIGNIGGEPYWDWYGYSARVEWCAIFVSWCAEQSGYIDAGTIPMFAYCPTGVQWFKDREQWQEGGYTPAPGDIIFFDWEPDGGCDHVGIVESADGEYVYTIEGNSSDSVARRSYELSSAKIYGYGIPAY
jgi:hypothetical protein